MNTAYGREQRHAKASTDAKILQLHVSSSSSCYVPHKLVPQ